MKDYKETLNLPDTSFPMKANLPNKEPEILKFWEDIGLYKKIRKQQKDAVKSKEISLESDTVINLVSSLRDLVETLITNKRDFSASL